MIFNTLFSATANPFQGTSEAEAMYAVTYENYITEYFEREAFQVKAGMLDDIKKAGISQDCVGFEIDLHNDGGADGTTCYAVYHVQIDETLPKSSREKVHSIFKKKIAMVPKSVDLLVQFKELVQKAVDGDHVVSRPDMPIDQMID